MGSISIGHAFFPKDDIAQPASAPAAPAVELTRLVWGDCPERPRFAFSVGWSVSGYQDIPEHGKAWDRGIYVPVNAYAPLIA